MPRLNQSTLASAAQRQLSFEVPRYDRTAIRRGIVHFGVGNFHRCHQAVYFHELLNQGYSDWGITGVSLRSSETKQQLAPQDFLYTEATLGKENQFRVVGSLLDILVAPQNPDAVVAQVADPHTQLLTTTITEKGYFLDSATIAWHSAELIAELHSLDKPETIYGFIAAALIKRHKVNAAPLSILCCDNIQAGGKHLHDGVQKLLNVHDGACAAWARENVSFSSSMVDRVAPKTEDSLKTLVASATGLDDAWPVSAEPFSQWVIEDNFAAQRPPLHLAGALFTKDVPLFENMKLRLLNAAHSMISSLGYLHGKETIHESLEVENILDFVTDTLRNTVLPATTIPEGFSGDDYISDVLSRFKNSALPYRVQQVNTDCSQKIQQRWFPTIDTVVAAQRDSSPINFVLAAWAAYIQQALERNQLNDPLTSEFLASVKQPAENVNLAQTFLMLAGAGGFEFSAAPAIMDAVNRHYQTIKTVGCEAALAKFLNMRPEEECSND